MARQLQQNISLLWIVPRTKCSVKKPQSTTTTKPALYHDMKLVRTQGLMDKQRAKLQKGVWYKNVWKKTHNTLRMKDFNNEINKSHSIDMHLGMNWDLLQVTPPSKNITRVTCFIWTRGKAIAHFDLSAQLTSKLSRKIRKGEQESKGQL